MEGMLEGETENPRSFGENAEMEDDVGPNEATPEEQQDYELLVIRSQKMMFGRAFSYPITKNDVRERKRENPELDW